MALTPNDVLNKQFATTRLKEGYDQDEVDDFLDAVLAEFQRLIGENENLTTKLSAAPPAADTGEVDSLREQLAAAQQRASQLEAELAQTKEQAAQSGALDGMNSAEYLQLARRVHEEHVREGVVKRDQLIAEGEDQSRVLVAESQSKADTVVVAAEQRATSLVAEAQTTAHTLTTESESKAESLVAEAQRRFDGEVAELSQQVSSLTNSKSALEQSVGELQEFERTYRDSLRSFLETQLGELGGVGTGSQLVVTDSVPTAQSFTGEQPSIEDSAQAPEPPVPGLSGETGEQPSTPNFGY